MKRIGVRGSEYAGGQELARGFEALDFALRLGETVARLREVSVPGFEGLCTFIDLGLELLALRLRGGEGFFGLIELTFKSCGGLCRGGERRLKIVDFLGRALVARLPVASRSGGGVVGA